ncbi:MAG: hypothetical protein P8Q46_05725 [Candidatus Thalassarchaeaceae archaeon]|nr:hypothetical protein [Candidatus Thalassarchaeaceae archaeon]
MAFCRDGLAMNRRNPIILCLVLLFSVTLIPSNAVAEGDDIIIESNMTWSEDMTLSQNVRVVNGGILNIVESEFTIEEGVEIFVDENSILGIDNSSLISSTPPGELVGYGYCDQGNRSGVKIEWPSSSSALVTMTSIEPTTFDGVTAYFENHSEALSGQEYSLEIENVPDGEIWIDLVGPLCHPPSISSISVKRANGGDFDCPSCIYATNAADFEFRNMMVYGSPGFTITSEGEFVSSHSNIFGGQISSSSNIHINDSLLNRVGPILLTSDDARIHLGGSTQFANSTDDHDIRARAHSSIIWGEDVSGSGGLTDKWERRISGQSLSFDAMFVTYDITGMHKFPSYSNFSNEMGVSFIDGGRDRVVEIAWSEDNTWEENPIWSEQAIVTISDYRTAWNPEESGIGDYGGGQFELVWDSEVKVESGTPMAIWDSLSVVGEDGALSEAVVGDSVNVDAEISNSGSAAAKLAITCEDVSTDATAQISPSFPYAVIGPGEKVTISFSWRVSVPGEDSISCRILTPTQLVDELAFGGGQTTSQSVNWTMVDDEDGFTIIPALIALAIAASAGGYFLFSIYNEREEDPDEEYQRIP